MKNHILLLTALFITNVSFSQKKERVIKDEQFLARINKNIAHLDTAIEQTYTIEKLNNFRSTELAIIESNMAGYCIDNNCDKFNAKIKELNQRINDRVDGLNTGNFVNLKLKKEVDAELNQLEIDADKVDTYLKAESFERRFRSLNSKYNVWMEENTKMPEWKKESTERLKVLEKKQAELLTLFPKFGNHTSSLLLGYKFTKHHLTGAALIKYKSYIKEQEKIEKEGQEKLNITINTNFIPNSKKEEKLKDKWIKFELDKQFLLKSHVYDVDHVSMIIYSSDKYLNSEKTFSIMKADSINKDHNPYNYVVTPTITQDELKSEIKVLVNYKRTPTKIEGEKIPAAEMFFTWTIKTEPADNEKNVKYILDLNYNDEISALNYEGKKVLLIYDLDMEAIKWDIIKKLKSKFELEVK